MNYLFRPLGMLRGCLFGSSSNLALGGSKFLGGVLVWVGSLLGGLWLRGSLSLGSRLGLGSSLGLWGGLGIVGGLVSGSLGVVLGGHDLDKLKILKALKYQELFVKLK